MGIAEPVSGCFATAKPHRIKASHRRRWKRTAAHREYQHTDALGTPVAITNASRTVTERREYEPYGYQLTPTLQDGPNYTGHVADAATGLIYMQARYYDSMLGIFDSVDPIGVNTQTAWNFCRYCYAGNNPYKFTDPDGRQQFPATFVMPQGFPVNARDIPAYERSRTAPGATRQQMARALDRISVGATTTALATSVDFPPVAVVAEGISEMTAVGAVLTDFTTERLLNVLTGGVLKTAKAVAQGSEAAETSVRAVEVVANGNDVNNVVNEARTDTQTSTPPLPLPPPPPQNPPRKPDDAGNQ